MRFDESAETTASETRLSQAARPFGEATEARPRKEMSRAFLALLAASAAAVFLLVTLGGVVRVTESGLGCPDWPLCQGKLVPPLEFHTLIEYAHRLAASLTSALIVATALVAWWRYRHIQRVVVPTTLALVLLGFEVILGGVTVLRELPPTIVTLHLATAEAILGLLLLSLVWACRGWRPVVVASPVVFPWAVAAALATFAVLMLGSYVVGEGAGTSCPGWPLCNGGVFPKYGAGWLHMAHRLSAAVGGALAAWAVALAWRRRDGSTAVAWASGIAGIAIIAQSVSGAANPWTGFAAIAKAAHLTLATAQWGSLVVMAALVWPRSVEALTERERSLGAMLGDYFALTKPLILVLLLITALGGMFLAAQGVPPTSVALLVMMGGVLGAGGANALNNYLDQEIDHRMHRTRRRSLPARRVPPYHAILLGLTLNTLAFAILALWVNLLSAILVIGATLFYVFVYTLWLKRSSPQSIVIGGAAGAIPPVVGWAAVTGGIGLPALYLFAMIFFWTPPHFWALSLLLRDDYARAGVPMLPVVRGVKETARSILLHSLVMVAITVLFFTTGAVGLLFLGGAVLLGAFFLFFAWRLVRTESIKSARRLYLYSLAYLVLLFVLVMVESGA